MSLRNDSIEKGKDLNKEHHQALTSGISVYPRTANDDLLRGLFGVEYVDCTYNLSSPIEDEALKNNQIELRCEQYIKKESGTWATSTCNNEEYVRVETATTSTCSPRDSLQREFAEVAEEKEFNNIGNVTNDEQAPRETSVDVPTTPDQHSNYEERYNSAFCLSAEQIAENQTEQILPNLDNYQSRDDVLDTAMDVDVGSVGIENMFSSALHIRDESSLDLSISNDREGEEMTINEQIITENITDSSEEPSVHIINSGNNENQSSHVTNEQIEEDANHIGSASQVAGSINVEQSIAPISMYSLPLSVDQYNTDYNTPHHQGIEDMNAFMSSVEPPTVADILHELEIFHDTHPCGRRKRKISKREAARLAAIEEQRKERLIAALAIQKKISDAQLLRLRPKKKRRAARFDKPVPSRFCHVCSRTPKNVRLAVCSNIRRGICRKVVCEKCFDLYKYADFDSVLNMETEWICPHCSECCPAKAQCGTYQKINDRLRVNRLKQSGPRNVRNRSRPERGQVLASDNVNGGSGAETTPVSPTRVVIPDIEFLNQFISDPMEDQVNH